MSSAKYAQHNDPMKFSSNFSSDTLLTFFLKIYRKNFSVAKYKILKYLVCTLNFFFWSLAPVKQISNMSYNWVWLTKWSLSKWHHKKKYYAAPYWQPHLAESDLPSLVAQPARLGSKASWAVPINLGYCACQNVQKKIFGDFILVKNHFVSQTQL